MRAIPQLGANGISCDFANVIIPLSSFYHRSGVRGVLDILLRHPLTTYEQRFPPASLHHSDDPVVISRVRALNERILQLNALPFTDAALEELDRTLRSCYAQIMELIYGRTIAIDRQSSADILSDSPEYASAHQPL